MKRAITTQDLKARIGDVVDEVRLRGSRYIIERRGKPVAALVPISVNDAYERSRERLFALIDTVHEQNRESAPEEVESAVDQAVREARASKKKRKPRT